MSFVQAAVYDAVVGIEGGYEPYRFHARAPRGASSTAAAIAAARKVLVVYSAAGLDNSLDQALALLPDNQAKTDGVAYGELAAQKLIDLRANDGRNAPVTFTTPPAPGVWRPQPVQPPTSPSTAEFLTPWLGGVTPLMIRSGAQFGEPGPPPALTSARYTRDFNEVKSLGAVNSTARTPDQTATALFFSGSAFVQTNAALRDQVDVQESRHHRCGKDVRRSRHDRRRRPHLRLARQIPVRILAAHQRDPTGRHRRQSVDHRRPDLAALAGDTALSRLRQRLHRNHLQLCRGPKQTLDTRHLQLTLISTAVQGVNRTYDSGRTLCNDVLEARIWLGIHFRTADTEAAKMGRIVAEYALDRNFEPVRGHGHGGD